MFIRKRVRQKAGGLRVYFTALRSVRTPAGPRQITVASWYSPADPGHPLYAPSVQAALDQIETDSFANMSPEKMRTSAAYWRELLRTTNGAWCIHKGKRFKREEIEARAEWMDKRAEAKEQEAEKLRTVLAEIGNWTWDEQL